MSEKTNTYSSEFVMPEMMPQHKVYLYIKPF